MDEEQGSCQAGPHPPHTACAFLTSIKPPPASLHLHRLPPSIKPPPRRLIPHPSPPSLSAATKRLAASRILSRVSEAYGRMMLLDGLFQADGHPGNILVMARGRVGLIDYGGCGGLWVAGVGGWAGWVGWRLWGVLAGWVGRCRRCRRCRRCCCRSCRCCRCYIRCCRCCCWASPPQLPNSPSAALSTPAHRRPSLPPLPAPRSPPPPPPAPAPAGQSKRLPDPYRAGLAHLILALDGGKEGEVSAALGGVGVVTERDDVPMRAKMATAMFDTRGK